MEDEERPPVQLPWGLDGRQVKANSLKTLSQSQLQAFSRGRMNTVVKKSALEKKREEEEEKKRLAEAEAARVFEAFAASFNESAPGPTGKVFVRSEDSTPAKTGRVYQPSLPSISNTKRLFTVAKGAKSKMSNLEALKEQLKREQEEREMHSTGAAPMLPDKGSFDTGDPHTTNLYLGNLSVNVTEGILCKEFGAFGPLASVKIMWPRTEEEKSRGRLCGFVAFMKRDDAASALRELNGKEVLGAEMKMGWGKAVPLPAAPTYVASDAPAASATKLPFSAQPYPGSNAADIWELRNTDVYVHLPKDRAQRQLIHRMVEAVLRHGPEFEAMIMRRVDHTDPTFTFLLDNRSSAHVYYRWRLFSLLQGDGIYDWRVKPFRMFEDGSLWHPPRPQHQSTKGHLNTQHRDQLEDQLEDLTMERRSIANLMVFCIDHADAATEIVDFVEESLVSASTPVQQKVARLYLVSDLLHNSSVVSVKHAYNYRNCLEGKLVNIFTSLNQTFRAIGGRLRAEQFRKQVMSCVHVWRDWCIYPSEFLQQLETIFYANSKEQQEAAEEETTAMAGRATSVSVTEPPAALGVPDYDDLDGVPLEPLSVGRVEADDGEDLDGVPLDLSEMEPPESSNAFASHSGEDADDDMFSASPSRKRPLDMEPESRKAPRIM